MTDRLTIKTAYTVDAMTMLKVTGV